MSDDSPEVPGQLVVHEGTPVPSTVPDLGSLLPLTDTQLTEEERLRSNTLQTAFIILGPVGGSALICPGNQINVSEDHRCPYSAKCELLKALKAPEGGLCPIERDYLLARFSAWSAALNTDPAVLSGPQRAAVSELTWLDVQSLRCSSIVSKGQAARLSQINVKEVGEGGVVLAWEKVIHTNVELLDRISIQRRMILKDWELTPEQQTKKARYEGNKNKGLDLSTQQSAKADRLRKLGQTIIDAE